MTYWLSKSGTTLRAQFDARFPKRDKASDGWIGDASHQASVSDHNPCWGCSGQAYGVVRATDIDKGLDKARPDAMQRAMNELVEYCRKGLDGHRVSYVIYQGRIASGSYASSYWKWRTYSGPNKHTEHAHISYTPRGDFRDGKFDLDIFDPSKADIRQERKQLERQLDSLKERYRALRVKIEGKRRKIKSL